MNWWQDFLLVIGSWILIYLIFINQKTSDKICSILTIVFKILTSFPMLLLSICLSVDAWNNITTSKLSIITKIIALASILIIHLIWFYVKWEWETKKNKFVSVRKEKLENLQQLLSEQNKTYPSDEYHVEDALNHYIDFLSIQNKIDKKFSTFDEFIKDFENSYTDYQLYYIRYIPDRFKTKFSDWYKEKRK